MDTYVTGSAIRRLRIECASPATGTTQPPHGLSAPNGGVPDGELFDPAQRALTQRFWIDNSL